MSKAIAIILGVLLLAVLVLFSTTYTVRFHELAIKKSFGRTSEQSVVSESGLHFRLPFFADRVSKLDTRIRLVETPQVEVPTADLQSVVVRAFFMWRVDTDNALEFGKNYPSGVEDADHGLKEHLHTAVKGSLGRYAFDDLIGPESRLADAEAAILAELQFVRTWGVEPVAVGISQLLLPPKTTTAVLARMQTTRDVLADTERFKGDADARGIQSEANTLADKLSAFANQRAEEIRAVGNLQAAIYLDEMSEDESLAIFLVWLDTLEESLKEGVTIVFTDDSAPWHLMNVGKLHETSDIPQPRKTSIASPAADQPAAADGDEAPQPERGS
ncbi:MAG: SPFH domain-containing protein [Planctomycetota bacterium]|jgi:membrane protease subunit HflC